MEIIDRRKPVENYFSSFFFFYKKRTYFCRLKITIKRVQCQITFAVPEGIAANLFEHYRARVICANVLQSGLSMPTNLIKKKPEK